MSPKKFTPIDKDALRVTLGKRLAALRFKAGLSIEKMADGCDVARRSYWEWETGRSTKLPRLDTLIKVCNAHEVPLEVLLAGER